MPVGSEIVGLVPKKAIEMAADFFLQLENFSPAQVFENKLAAALSGAPMDVAKDGKLAGIGAAVSGGGGKRPRYSGRRKRLRLCWSARSCTGADGCGTFAEKEIASGILWISFRRRWTKMRRIADELAEAIDRDAASYDAVNGSVQIVARGRAGNAAARGSHTESDERRFGSAAAGGRAKC